MATVYVDHRTNLKSETQILRRLGKQKKKRTYESENTKQFRIVQSVKVWHIRGGPVFH